MKTNTSRFTVRRKILWTSGILLVIILGIFGYLLINHKINSGKNTPNTSSVNYGSATSDQKKNGTSIKSNSTSTTGGSDQPTTPTPIPGSTQKSVSVTITAANQNGPTLQIRALIGAVEDVGTCTLQLAQAGQQTVTETAGTQALASTSTCKGFDVPVSELATGIWHITITYNSMSLTGATTKDVSIQ